MSFRQNGVGPEKNCADAILPKGHDLVVTWAQVLDRKDGKIVKGLEIDDFVLREDGKPQQISMIKEGQPLSVVMLVECLACAIEPPEWLLPQIHDSLRQLGDDAEIALMAWDYDTALVQPMTTDQNLIAHRLKDKNAWINALRPRSVYPGGGAAEFARPGEAVYRAAQYLEKNAAPGRRKVIIVIGHPSSLDEFHQRTAAEVNEIIEKTGTTVYGLYESYYPEIVAKFQRQTQKDKKGRSGGTVEEFVEQTGGAILIGTPEEGDELLIKLGGLIRSGQASPGISAVGRKPSPLH